MKYPQKTFTVPTGSRDAKGCEHGMVRPKDGSCCFCGASQAQVKADTDARQTR